MQAAADTEDRCARLQADLAAYGDPTDAGRSVDTLHLRLLPDRSMPQTEGQVLLAFASIRMWKERVIGAALVRDVQSGLRLMSEDISYPIEQRRLARTLLRQLLAPLASPWHKGLFSTQDLMAVPYLLELRQAYTQALRLMQQIVASTGLQALLAVFLR
jgi:hypothetical protein